MQWSYCRPEEAGVSSGNIQKYVEMLEQNHFSTHNLILIRGDKIFYENYWAPFTPDFLHRMYSVTKSFVSLAIGFLEQDGLIDLDDKIVKYFPKETENEHGENLHRQTIRHMLKMSTSIVKDAYWFHYRDTDRVEYYFEGSERKSRVPGLFFEYDSNGSFILGALVERVTGKLLTEYLWEKLFSKIGVSKEAYCLKCPGGHSWGDSALLCTPRDLALTARFVMNKGKWDGEQILNEKYLTEATSVQIYNNEMEVNESNTQGYGYQFWMCPQGGFYFNGMGCQYGVCVPEKDMIMIYNADNQGRQNTYRIINGFYDMIVNTASDSALDQNNEAFSSLEQYSKGLKLATALGKETVPFMQECNGRKYVLEKNPMGIKWFMLKFDGTQGHFLYENEQGEKDLVFGLGYNEFGLFPQEGYSDELGGAFEKGHYYKCASSAGWVEEKKLNIRVQIIDKYFGNLNIYVGFEGEDTVVWMWKCAEDFLEEYNGFANGRLERES